MAIDTKDYLQQAYRRLCQDPQALASHERHRLVRAIAEMVLGPDAAGNAVLANLLDLLARDPDWTVRLEVARMVHLLDDEAGRRCAGLLHRDCNSYVRSHAQRSLTRQRLTEALFFGHRWT